MINILLKSLVQRVSLLLADVENAGRAAPGVFRRPTLTYGSHWVNFHHHHFFLIIIIINEISSHGSERTNNRKDFGFAAFYRPKPCADQVFFKF